MLIKIGVTNKVARADENHHIVCGNSDYKIQFSFDSEWDDYEVKIARFNFTRNGVKEYINKVFTGVECDVPILSGVKAVEIGVYAGNLHTTTPCLLKCERSVLCDSGFPTEPPEGVYNEILEVCNEAVVTANGVKQMADNGEFKGEKGDTPQKGVDYYTDEDREEFKNDILADPVSHILLSDNETGLVYKLYVSNGSLKMEVVG